MYASTVKRILDALVASIMGILLSPLLLLIGVLVRINLGSPVFFRQERPGRGGEIFTLIKFRTMRERTDSTGRVLPDEARVTQFGSWLRATSLDELPELWNVLMGDMSLVGPRPLLPGYLDLYSEHQARRHEVRPGLTGLGQVSGRNLVNWPERFELDVWYVDNLSAKLDASILRRTLLTVLRRDGISADGDVSMPPFEGN